MLADEVGPSGRELRHRSRAVIRGFVRTLAWLALKDIRIEARSRTSLWSAIVLGTASVMIVGLSFAPSSPSRSEIVAPLLLMTTLYAALMIGDRLEAIDHEDDGRSWLWLTVADRPAIFLAKVFACTTMLFVVILWTSTLAMLLLDLRVVTSPWIPMAVGAMVALSTASVTTFTATLLASGAHRSLLLPAVSVPFMIPTSIASVQASRAVTVADGGPVGPWLAILGIEALLFCGIGLLTYELVGGPS